MGLSWQQGPLAPGAIGRFLVPDPLPERLLFAEPLRRRMRVRFGGAWIADSEDIMLLHEPGRYQVAYFPPSDIADGVLEPSPYITRHADLGATSWYSVRARGQAKPRAAWQHTELPAYASELRGRAAFAWRAMDAFYEEDERTASGHAADFYHRIDTRQASRHLIVRDGHRVVADTTRPLALYESGFAPRWHVPRADLDQAALTATQGQTFCPYKGLASYYDIGDAHRAAWSYQDAWTEARRISGPVSFEPDKIAVYLDGTRLRLEPGQTVFPHGIDRDLPLDEVIPRTAAMNGTDKADCEVTQPRGTCQRVGMPPGRPTRPAAVAITPALGPLPAIYVQQSPAPGTTIRTFVRWVKGLRRQGVAE